MKPFFILTTLLWAWPLAAQSADSNPPTLESALAQRPVFNGDLTLDAAVTLALKESPVVRGAEAEVEAALGRLNAARAERKPWLSANTFVSGGSLPNIVSSPLPVQPQMLMGLPRGAFADVNVMLMVPLLTSGRLKAMVRQAAALRDAAQADGEAERQEVALLTRTVYREVLARRALVAVQSARLKENQERLRLDRIRAEAGKIPAFTIFRSEAEVAATQQELTNAERDVELSLLQLKVTLGVHPDSQITLTDTLQFQPGAQWVPAVANTDLSALLHMAEQRRPELQAVSRRVQSAQADIQATRGAYGPQVNAFGIADLMKMKGQSVTGGTTFGLAASIPILNGGQKSARLQTADAERRRQEAQRQRVALQVAQEVSAGILNLKAAEQNVQTSQSALKAAQEDYRVALLRYQEGRSIVVEILDALAARVQAESNIVQALYAYNAARDQLLRAVGVIIDAPPIN